MTPVQKALALREGGQTTRCHTMHYFGHYDVAIHSFNALNLLFVLYPPPDAPSLNLIQAILWHDIPERWTGDVPTPAKLANKVLKEEVDNLENEVLKALELADVFVNLTPKERDWLRAVDLLELFVWGKEQEAMGNVMVANMNRQIIRIFESRSETPLPVLIFVRDFEYIRNPECQDLLHERK